MGEFSRNRLPDTESYFESEGLALQGKGKWRTTECVFHGGSDSFRVNVSTGGWVCMNCGESGGDVLAFHMKRHELDFVSAAKALGAYDDDAGALRGGSRPSTLPARSALEVLRFEALVVVVAVRNIEREGTLPPEADWQRVLQAARRIEMIAEEVCA